MDCFAALAMTGEGCFMPPLTLPVIARSAATKQSTLSYCGEMDCFAEPVIGRAFARPGGSQ